MNKSIIRLNPPINEMKDYVISIMLKQLSLSSKISPNPVLPAAFVPFFSLEFSVGFAMKILMKKNAAANGLELAGRLQGLTATDMTHGY